MVIIEWVDQLCFGVAHQCHFVSMDLCLCHHHNLSSALACFVFPVIMETVLNAVGDMDSYPLSVDLGASCWMNPCNEVFSND
jgi:hypothetical protein